MLMKYISPIRPGRKDTRTQHKRDAIEKAMGGKHSGITDTTLCTVDDDALLKKLYGM